MRHSTYLEVCLGNIAHNVNNIRHLVGEAKLIPMVKGNAYGHGIERVSQFLHDVCGMNKLGVASLGEALAIRDKQPSIAKSTKSEIFVFSDTEILNEGFHHYYQASGQHGVRLTPILGTTTQLKKFCTSSAFKRSKLCLKVNTGMNRLGLKLDEIKNVIPLLKQRGGVDLLLQHFSVAVSLDRFNETIAHYDNFRKVKELLSDSGVEVRATSVSNSGAIEQQIGINEDYVRPGIMLYGPRSVRSKILWNGYPASYFYTKVLRHFPVRKGEGVGYDLFPAREDGVMVLLPIGYADGLLRSYQGMPITVTPHDAQESITGILHGMVNMDMAAVMVYPKEVGKDMGEIMTAVKDESRILVWGGDIGEKAIAVGSIPYQLMCGLSIRVPRVYRES
ncbi:putative alanine racemase 2 [Trypanosoma theileri]|uniref:Putative alanine racemase 2 n=1 Tax=Trypanosoma theileri TaxID=67003 RepID=A0A1X0NHP0_9TRYP|nr:putative alanine racemase 2 [Trypanosoma theileri]ORC84111.1 putative alanine racemase 2 [Trypanosoma theileri]